MAQPHIGYFVSQFPCYDETFINREMQAVRDAGAEVTIFSLKRSRDRIVHQSAEALSARAVNFPLFFSARVWGAVAKTLLAHPLRLLLATVELFRHACGSADFLLKGFALIPLACAYARLARERGVTHLHAHWATHPTTLALFVSRLGGLPFSFTGHAHDIYVNTAGLRHKLRTAKFVLTCTAANKTYLRQLCPDLPAGKIVVSYHGLDVNAQYAPPASPPPERPFRIVSVGSCLPCKGYDRLIAACVLLEKQGLDFRLDIVGGGPLQAELEALRDRLGLRERVAFHGYTTQERMPEHYKSAHVFALASVPEIHWGIPNVVVEALACGVPVVTTALPALPELVRDGDCGILLPAPEPELLAAALSRLASAPELRRAMGTIGRARVCEMFDLKKNANQVLTLLAGEKANANIRQTGIADRSC